MQNNLCTYNVRMWKQRYYTLVKLEKQSTTHADRKSVV